MTTVSLKFYNREHKLPLLPSNLKGGYGNNDDSDDGLDGTQIGKVGGHPLKAYEGVALIMPFAF